MPPPAQTGILRSDLELIRPGRHGDYPMLFDPHADAYYRISERMMQIIGFLDRSRPFETFRQELHLAGIEVEAEELAAILQFLQQNNLLIPEFGQIKLKNERRRQQKQDTWLLRLSSAYLFFKLPPWRPEKFLAAVRPLFDPLASRPVLILVALPALLGYLLICRDLPAVAATFRDTLSWSGLAKYLAAIILLKLLHEAAHVIAAAHFNCRVRGIGVGFMIFYPRFYTDTTDSWRLPRRQRLLIDGAGIIVELLTGGLAALLWCYLPPGPWRSTMFYIFAVSTLSTLLVNGNPFIRYDGYYILCDLTGVDNLMSRSSEYLKRFWRWHFLRLGERPREANGAFLLFFGIGSFVYRIFLYTSIILIIYHKFIKAVALVLLVLEFYSLLLYPMYREIQVIRQLSRSSANRARRLFLTILLLLIAVVLFLPLSWNLTCPGEIAAEQQQLITVPEPGYLTRRLPEQPLPVAIGDILAVLESPQLSFQQEKLNWTYREDLARFELQQVDPEHHADASISWSKLRSDRTRIKEFERRREELSIKAGQAGVFVPAHRRFESGLFLNKGQSIGHIFSGRTIVHAYGTDRDVSRIRPDRRVTVRLPDQLTGYAGRITTINPIPARLHNSPLLQQYGGPVPVYVNEKTPGDFVSVMALYRLEIEFDAEPALFCGRTVQVVVHHREALFFRLKELLISAFRREL